MKILLTGFEPFGESAINPSQECLTCFPDLFLEDCEIIKAILPVDQEKGPHDLLTHMHQTQPDAVLCLGLASGRAVISLERVAINLKDFRMADNSGVTISDQPVVPDGPAAYFSRLPLRKMETALKANHIPCELSLSAGAYLCNQVFYTLLHEIAVNDLNIPAGFVHLPALPQQAAKSKKQMPSMSLQIQLDALEILLTELRQSAK